MANPYGTPPKDPYADPMFYTYAAVFYLVGSTWYQRAVGWNLDVSSLIYDAPTFPVYVWWWNGSQWTPEMIFNRTAPNGNA